MKNFTNARSTLTRTVFFLFFKLINFIFIVSLRSVNFKERNKIRPDAITKQNWNGIVTVY